MLKVATVFSGIGAFEYALKKMNVPHEILFACDNGERELRFTYKTLAQLSEDLDDNNKRQFANILWTLNKLEDTYPSTEQFYEVLYGNHRLQKVLNLPYDCIMLLTQGMTTQEREEYVCRLYERTKRPNWVKQSYLANYPITGDRWHEDIRFLDGTQFANEVDILVGGSPCQSFSTYGKKLGLEDTRGTLFHDYARIIQEIQPKVFIYENVKNIQKHDHGHTWEVMLRVWNSLDYALFPKILNAKDYGIPQCRRRLFLVGIRRDILRGRKFEFPAAQELTCTSHDFMEKEVEAKYYLGKKGFEWVTNPIKNQRRTRANYDIQGCQTATQQDNWTGDLRVEDAQQWQKDDERIYVGIYEGKESVARKMTPKECLRMMGFDDFRQVVSDKVMYRQSGNSIVVNVLEAIYKQILPFIE